MKHAFITGASGGIGLAIAGMLARDEFRITLGGRNADSLRKAADSLHAGADQKHEIFVADLSRHDDIMKAGELIQANQFDVLINNAGAGLYGRFEELNLEDQLRSMRLNMDALVSLSHAYIKKARKGDSLINIASVPGHTSCPGSATYAATKAFVVNFSQALWRENKARGIQVCAFCPGVTSTNFHAASGGQDDQWPGYMTQTPEAVAREAVKALRKRRGPVVISGMMNRQMIFSGRLMSKGMSAGIMAGYMKKYAGIDL